MAQFFSALSAVGVIFGLVLTGAFCGWRGWMKPEDKVFCIKVVINIGTPAMCLCSILNQVDMDMLRECAVLVGLSVAALAVLLAASLLVSKGMGLPRSKAGSFVVMSGYANAMFIGMPVCQLLFGEAAMPYALSYYLVNMVCFQSVGLFLMHYFGAKGGSPSVKSALLQMLKPPLLSVLLALALMALDLRPPEMVMNWLQYLSNLVTPLALLYAGYVLYENGLRNLRMERSHWAVMFFRFLAAPALAVLLCRLAGVGGLAAQVLAIEIATPAMTQTVVYAADTNQDETYTLIGMATTTLACFVVIPVLMALLS